MIAQDLIQAAEQAITVAHHRPDMLAVALDRLAHETDRLLDLEGGPASPLRDAGQRIAGHLVTARAAHPAAPLDVLEALQGSLRQATLVLRLIEVLPLLPPPALPATWALPVRSRPTLSVIQGGRA